MRTVEEEGGAGLRAAAAQVSSIRGSGAAGRRTARWARIQAADSRRRRRAGVPASTVVVEDLPQARSGVRRSGCPLGVASAIALSRLAAGSPHDWEDTGNGFPHGSAAHGAAQRRRARPEASTGGTGRFNERSARRRTAVGGAGRLDAGTGAPAPDRGLRRSTPCRCTTRATPVARRQPLGDGARAPMSSGSRCPATGGDLSSSRARRSERHHPLRVSSRRRRAGADPRLAARRAGTIPQGLLPAAAS
jgi:hypothetical protein